VKKRTAKKVRLALFLILTFVVYVWISSSRLIVDAGGEYFAFSVSNCSYAAIDAGINQGFFKDVCKIEKDERGKVSCVKTDTFALNALSAKLASDCYDRLDGLVADGFLVPAGVFTGIRVFAGAGKKVRVKYVCVLSVQCDMVRTFASSGINQTRLTLSAVIHANISLYTPIGKKCYDEKIDVPVFDNFIIGEVPGVYLGTEVFSGRK